MELLAKCVILLISVLVIWALCRAGQARRVFVIRIRDGEPRAVVGKVTAAFLQRIREVAADHGVATGEVSGLARGRRISLDFSRQIPAPGRQQLRNWWAASGWAITRRRA